MSQDVQQHRQPEATPVGHSGTRVDIQERPAWAISGWLGVLVVAACIAATVLLVQHEAGALVAVPIVVGALVASSLTMVQPGHTKVVRFFGSYAGTVRRSGLWWVVPLADRRNLSIRVRNFETNHLKVNDADGNPVEIAAIVVWQIADTSRASYAVDDYVNFVEVQAESALRHVATTHPYDDPTGEGTSLRGDVDLVAAELAREVAQRVTIAGVEIVEVRISHLAYAPEIAQAMLRRQQANAVVAARSRIVEGSVGMVEMALAALDERGIVELDDERRAAMVSNLLVVLCADQPVSPGRQHRNALYVSASRERKQLPLRIDPAVHDALARWAADDLRSVNAQIEMLLRRALDDAGRMPRQAGPMPRRGRPPRP